LDEVANVNAEERSETASPAASTSSNKILPRHEEDTFEIIEIHTVSTEIQNDTNFHMNLHLEGKGGSGGISLLPHFLLTPIKYISNDKHLSKPCRREIG
jgi:hypothetical protein